MKSKILIISTIFIALFASGCKKDKNNTTKLTGIFVSGYSTYYTNGSWHSMAKYWKDGVVVDLSDSTTSAQTSAIGVLGNDVYVTGYEIKRTTGKTVAKYWKNGVGVELTDGTFDAEASSIFISGNDVYISGFDGARAVYWKNGVANNSGSGKIESVYLLNNDLYTAGEHLSTTNEFVGYGQKDDVSIPSKFLSSVTGLKSSFGKKIIADNNDVYVATTDNYNSAHFSVKVWKNNDATVVTTGAVDGYFGGMDITGSSVYIATNENGYASVTNVYDSRNSFDVGGGIKPCVATSLHFFGTERYITGAEYTGYVGVATYWKKDRSSVALTDGTYTCIATDLIEVK